jgi:glycosyltransferase involved in cell wall biosynthesis
VTCIGNLYQGAAWKGFDVLLKAWTHVSRNNPHARLIMVGAGSPVVWQEMAKELNISDSVMFWGERVGLKEVFSETALLVSSSRQEGMPNTVLEAQAWGLPVVVTDIPGSRDIVIQGETGCIVPPDDPDHLGEVLIRLLDDEDMRQRMGARGREHVRDNFSFEKIAGQVLAVYSSLLNDRTRWS